MPSGRVKGSKNKHIHNFLYDVSKEDFKCPIPRNPFNREVFIKCFYIYITCQGYALDALAPIVGVTRPCLNKFFKAYEIMEGNVPDSWWQKDNEEK